MTQLKEKIVWITGASSGIGEALTYQLANLGCKLILSSRRVNELERVKQSCQETNVDNIKILPLDLGENESLITATQQALEYFGNIDILINNGGISQRGLAINTSLEVERQIMEINFFSAITLTKLILPNMIARKTGHLVIISSLVGKFGSPYRSTYAASKHALHGYFDSLRAELWQDNIKITLVCPGYIQTNISKNALTSTGEKHGKMDKNQLQGIAVNDCTAKIIEAIMKDKPEIYIAKKEIIAIYLKRFYPQLLARVIRGVNREFSN
jgi:short-subunit dehydrogenase